MPLAKDLGSLVGRRFAEVPVTGRGAAAERIHDFFTYLVAAGPDARSHRHKDVPCSRAEDTTHLAYGLLNDPPRGPPPAGMHGGNGSEPGVHHQDGHAIGRTNGKQNARLVRKEGVAGATLRVP